MEINQEITQQLEKQEKYIQFLHWAKQNGALINDAVRYPSAFGSQGFTGVSAQNDIQANVVIIAIPNKLIISANKVYKSELYEVFQAHSNLFNDELCIDAEFNCLALYIFYHKLKGQDSFWFPYLNVVEQFTLFEWRSRDIHNIQDQSLVDEFHTVQKEMEKSWHRLRQAMIKHPKFFPNISETHKDLFYWSCEFVMTRCFGWTVPSTSLIPFADMLNHSSQATTYHLIKVDNEQNSNSNSHYIVKNNKIDLSLLKNIKQEHLDLIHKPQLTDVQAYIESNKIFLTQQFETDREKVNFINKSVLALWKEKQIWELDFESSSDSEDNDSDESSDSDEEHDTVKKRIDKIKQQEIKILKERRHRYIKNQFEEQIKEQQQISNEKCLQLLQKIIPQQTQYKNVNVNHSQIKGRNNLPESMNNSMDDNNNNINIGSNSNSNQNSKIQDQKQDQEESNTDSEKDFDWYSEEDPNIYFCITTTNPIKKGDQIYTFYGRRNNKFLLLWYGFATARNKYNSYYCRIWLNQDPMPFNDQIYNKILINEKISLDHLKCGLINNIPISQLSKQIRIKSSRLCDDLIIHLRMLLMSYYTGKDANQILLTVPISKDFEIFVFDFALKLLSNLVQKFKTTYQEDLIYMDKGNLVGEVYFALQYNIDYKEIILLQIQHIKEAIKYLQNHNVKNFKDYYMQLPIDRIRPLRNYIKYL